MSETLCNKDNNEVEVIEKNTEEMEVEKLAKFINDLDICRKNECHRKMWVCNVCELHNSNTLQNCQECSNVREYDKVYILKKNGNNEFVFSNMINMIDYINEYFNKYRNNNLDRSFYLQATYNGYNIIEKTTRYYLINYESIVESFEYQQFNIL